MKKDVKVKLVAIAKDEAAYLPEWIFHHLNIGFDAIDIYVNNTSDNTWDIAKKLKNLSCVNFINADVIFNQHSDFPQENTYRIAYEANKNSDFAYLMFLDIDEFWLSKAPDVGVKETLSKLNYPDILSLTWFLHFENTEFSFLYDNPVKGVKNRWVKTIFSLELDIERIDVHNVKAKNAQYQLIDGTEWKFGSYGKSAGHLSNDYNQSIDRTSCILHRMYRSELEYVSILLRGNPGTRGKIGSKFKTNRKGFFSKKSPNECIYFPSDVCKKIKQQYLDFLQTYDLFIELDIAITFVRERYAQTWKEIEKSEQAEYITLSNILNDVTLDEVVSAFRKFKNRVHAEVNSKVLNTVRELAISIEDVDVTLANKLMLLAKELKPDGKLINGKLNQYAKIIE